MSVNSAGTRAAATAYPLTPNLSPRSATEAERRIHFSNNPRPAAALLDRTICADGSGTPEYEDDDEYEDDMRESPKHETRNPKRLFPEQSAPRLSSELPKNPQSTIRSPQSEGPPAVRSGSASKARAKDSVRDQGAGPRAGPCGLLRAGEFRLGFYSSGILSLLPIAYSGYALDATTPYPLG